MNELPNRDQLIARLKASSKTRVTFRKVDGTERVMNCTLMEGQIPAVSKDETTSKHKISPAVVVAYDLDKNGWRSFRHDSVISVEDVIN